MLLYNDVVRLIFILHCLFLKDAELYKLGHASSFHYLNQSRTYDLEGTNNEDEYWKTKRAMDIVGISRKDQVPNRTLTHLRYFSENIFLRESLHCPSV
jgi:hypothetical protein